MASTTITIRLDEEEKNLISEYANAFDVSISDFARKAMLKAIEDNLDYRIGEKAHREFLKNPVTYTSDEVMSELNLH